MLSYNYGAQTACPGTEVHPGGGDAGAAVHGTDVECDPAGAAEGALIRIFSSDATLVSHAVRPLNLYFAAFVFMDLQYIGQMVFQSLNKKEQAHLFLLF